ncbi:hypothetical protein MJT46_012895 [Ovis ammon polii x Ovis aries]|nr:hypothetical protein MJT46_012895 [Ovis ammon polii x Ovis aries]
MMIKAQELLTLEDVAVEFNREEWQLLDSSQRDLYWDVMLENYNNLVSLGYQGTKPDLLSKLEHGKEPCIIENEMQNRICPGFQASTPEVLSKLEQGEPWMMDDEIHCQTRSEVWKFDDHLLEYLQNESMEKRLEPWHEQNQLENAFHQSITHFLLRQHHDVFGLHGKCMKSNLTLLSQNLSYEIKSSSEFTGDEKSCRHADSEQFHPEIKFPQSQKLISSKSPFSEHQKTKKTEKPHVCGECGKAFIKKSWLTDHQIIHTGEKPHQCNLCDKAFSRKFMLTEHQRTHTGEKPYQCTDCGKAFLKKSRLNIHQKTHTGEKRYICSDCGKGFIQKGNLIVHQRIHTGEKPYTCNECGKGFIQKTCLIAHQRFHTGKTPFMCSECGKSCSQKSGLIKHQRIHTGEKPFECSDCGKAFTTKQKLIVHQRTHTGERPYTCNECGKAFAYMSCLGKHKKIHTREKHGDAIKGENPASQTSDAMQKKNLVNLVAVHVPSMALQPSVNISELLANRNVIIMGPPVGRCAPAGDDRGSAEDRTLKSAVSMVVPSVVNYVLFCTVMEVKAVHGSTMLFRRLVSLRKIRQVSEQKLRADPRDTSTVPGVFREQKKMIQAQETLTFDDVAMDFTWEEWQLLTPVQKALYRHVMLENYSNLVSAGFQASISEVLSKLDQGEPWMMDDEIHCQTRSEHRLRTIDLIVKNLIVANILVLFSGGFHNTMANFEWHIMDSDFTCEISRYVHGVSRSVPIGTTVLLSVFQAITICPQTSSSAYEMRKELFYVEFLSEAEPPSRHTLAASLLHVKPKYFLFPACEHCLTPRITKNGFHDTVKNFEWHFMDSDFACRFFPYVRVVGRGVSIGTTFLLSVFQAITISPRTAKWAELKVKALKCMVPSVILCWTLNMLVNVIYPMYMSGTLRNRSTTNRKDLGHCSAVSHGQPEDSLYAVLLSFPDALCFVLMILASGSTVFILYRHKQRVQNFRRTNISTISSPESRATKTILLLTVFGMLGNFSLLYHYLFLYCTGIRLKSIDLLVKNLIVANILVLLSCGFHNIVANFQWRHLDRDFACRFFPYVRVVGRGVSIGTTCLLSVFQVITISPRNSKWAGLKVKALKYVVPSIVLCWIVNMLVNVIYLMFLSGDLSNKSITNRKRYGHCSSVRHDQTRDSLYAALLSFPDVVCFVVMIWASGSTVLILYRHKQRVQNIHSIKISSISSPESRATRTILLVEKDVNGMYLDFVSLFTYFHQSPRLIALTLVLTSPSRQQEETVAFSTFICEVESIKEGFASGICYPVLDPEHADKCHLSYVYERNTEKQKRHEQKRSRTV